MNFFIISIIILVIKVCDLITVIFINKRINQIEKVVITNHTITTVLADDLIKRKIKEVNKNG